MGKFPIVLEISRIFVQRNEFISPATYKMHFLTATWLSQGRLQLLSRKQPHPTLITAFCSDFSRKSQEASQRGWIPKPGQVPTGA